MFETDQPDENIYVLHTGNNHVNKKKKQRQEKKKYNRKLGCGEQDQAVNSMAEASCCGNGKEPVDIIILLFSSDYIPCFVCVCLCAMEKYKYSGLRTSPGREYEGGKYMVTF